MMRGGFVKSIPERANKFFWSQFMVLYPKENSVQGHIISDKKHQFLICLMVNPIHAV